MNKKVVFYMVLLSGLLFIVALGVSFYIFGQVGTFLNKDDLNSIGDINNIIGLLTIIISAFIIYPLAKIKQLLAKIQKDTFPSDGIQTPEKTYDALIFTVSKSAIPILMIKTYQPKVIGLVGSKEVLDSLNEIKAAATLQGIRIYLRVLEDADTRCSSF
jgi:ABC-type dipeptide/oligopeptide/nickel transport system permease component